MASSLPASTRPTTFAVSLQGFSDFERSALTSCFRLANGRFPAYEPTGSMREARFIVADADHPGVVEQVLAAGRLADTMFIGSQAPDGALAWMMRPIDPVHVLRRLDASVALYEPRPADLPLPAAPPGQPTRRADDRQPALPPSVLMVDDSELALVRLERQLQALGLRAERASNSSQALERLSHHAFRFVFIDVELGLGSELDGLALCRHIQHHHRHAGNVVPAVFLLSSHDQAVDRVRGSLAGCDAYLGKPLADEVLRRTLNAHGATLTRG
jgi:CheY-like chemotaxis protein